MNDLTRMLKIFDIFSFEILPDEIIKLIEIYKKLEYRHRQGKARQAIDIQYYSNHNGNIITCLYFFVNIINKKILFFHLTLI